MTDLNPNGPNKLFGPSRAAVTGGAVLRGTSASPRSLAPLGESGTKFDSSKLLESKILRWSVKACTLRAVPRCAQMGFGEQNPGLNHGWVGRQTTPKPHPEATARSAVRGRREAPCVAVAAAAVAAAAVVVAAAVAKILFCSWLLGTGQPCSRDCHARL